MRRWQVKCADNAVCACAHDGRALRCREDSVLLHGPVAAILVPVHKIVVGMLIGDHFVEIFFEALPDRLGILIHDQKFAVGEYQRALFPQQSCRTDIQDLVWINQDFLATGRQTSDEKHLSLLVWWLFPPPCSNSGTLSNRCQQKL